MVSLKDKTLIALTWASFIIVILMAFATVSSSAAPTRVLLTANSYLDNTDGIYSVMLFVNVSCWPDGTLVDFSINVSEPPSNPPTDYTRQWYPIDSGNLNGNNSQFVSVPTTNDIAVARYGWFPDNKIPIGYVKITAILNNTPNAFSNTVYLTFNGTTQIIWTSVPTMQGSDAPPDLVTPIPTSTPTPTQLSPMMALLSLTIGAAIVSAVRRK